MVAETGVSQAFTAPTLASSAIGFHNATFAWSRSASTPALDGSVSLSDSRRNFVLRINGDITFAPDVLNLIVGPTGSGKTSLLLALLGEMHFVASGVDSGFYLPREGGVAYAAQEPWVLNETIRNNIVFGEEFDEDRYRAGEYFESFSWVWGCLNPFVI